MFLPRGKLNSGPFLRARDGTAWSVPTDVWTPETLGDALVAWWSAADLSDGAVSSWTDGVGSLELAQATAANQPTRSATSFNGLPGVTFDGGDHVFTDATTGLPTGSTAGEAWIVWSPSATSTSVTLVSYGGTSAATARELRMGGAASGGRAQVADRSTVLTDHNPVNGAVLMQPGDFCIHGGHWSGTTEGGRAFGRDFVANATATIATLNTGTVRTRIGGQNGNTATSLFSGVIADVLIVTTLTAGQRQQMEGWLAHHYGITSVLPEDHPFKSAAP